MRWQYQDLNEFFHRQRMSGFANRQPSWVVRIALLVALLALFLPLLALVLVALVVGAGVFLMLRAIAAVQRWLLSWGQASPPSEPDNGRRNVRVIDDR